VIYKPSSLPNPKDFINLWQKLARDNGLKGIFFIAHESDLTNNLIESVYDRDMRWGFDAINIVNKCVHSLSNLPLKYRILRRLFYRNKKLRIIPNISPYDPTIYQTNYDTKENVFPSILPNWDHTPRTGIDGNVIITSSPEKFEKVCQYAFDAVKNKANERKFVFIKSWNEWAEGNHMEPDLKYGKKYLEVLKKNLF
jgi:hypothetical protein